MFWHIEQKLWRRLRKHSKVVTYSTIRKRAEKKQKQHSGDYYFIFCTGSYLVFQHYIVHYNQPLLYIQPYFGSQKYCTLNMMCIETTDIQCFSALYVKILILFWCVVNGNLYTHKIECICIFAADLRIRQKTVVTKKHPRLILGHWHSRH